MEAGAGQRRRRVTVFTTDPIGPAMPGPAIRAWNLAYVLAQYVEVVLASTVGVAGSHPNAELRHAYGPDFSRSISEADVIYAPSALVYMSSELRDCAKPVAVDIYDPYHLENLERSGISGAGTDDAGADAAGADAAGTGGPGGPGIEEHDAVVTRLAGVINVALRRGDFFTCASERQRDFWLGSLSAMGRLNPYNYAQDPLFYRLVSLVPFGLPSRPPQRKGRGFRGTLPGVAHDDKVVLWGGGVYDWLDPLAVVRAVDRLKEREPRLRLVFLGMQHPNRDIPRMGVAGEVERLSSHLGLTGSHVFFNAAWVPYEERADYLLDADVAVSTHLDHIETRYSFRSRVLDYLWASLPMVLTSGDVLAAEVASAGLGMAVAAGDDAALEDAIWRMLAKPPAKSLFAPVASRYTWDAVAQPLVRY
ncbi:MAG TPA: glycosyltransferase, partial [Acidimicrobiales bacterium]|nr:glycosyltransferase [Acidimicrobiales bacterium]